MWISHKKACINIKNNDNKCFKYCIECAVLGICDLVHPERMTHYRQRINEEEGEEIIWNIDYPTSSEDITNFENDNDDISVNVYRMNENNKSILAHRLTHKQNAKYHVDLLLLTNEDGLHHYVYIKDFGRLMNSQINKTQHKKYHCRTCLHPFKSKENLLNHIKNGCISCVGTKVVLPIIGESDKTKFKNVNNQYEMPFTIYADFESLTRKIPHDEKKKVLLQIKFNDMNHVDLQYMLLVL
jgi:hypothetical protein